MAQKDMKGILITFEGSEGSGKSTQSKLLYRFLRRKRYGALYLREPGGTGIGEKIRGILLDPDNKSITPLCETLLYMAARAQLVSEVIQPALKKGKIVICDRFLDSTIAYQGYGLGVDIKSIKQMGVSATYGIKPSLTIFMDLAVKKGLGYRILKKDRIERRPFRYHQRVRNGYYRLAGLEPGRIKIVRVDKDKNVTQQKIRNLALGLIRKYI